MKFPVNLPASREFGFRDGFARDCLLQRGVSCEPNFLEAGAEEFQRSCSRVGSASPDAGPSGQETPKQFRAVNAPLRPR